MVPMSRAERVYERISPMEIGDVLTYPELEELLGRNVRAGRAPVYRAVQRLQREKKRTLVCVTNVGYRMIHAREHEELARSYHRKSQRQMRHSLNVAQSADRRLLNPEERERIDRLERIVLAHEETVQHLEDRANRQEKALDMVRQQTAAESQELAGRLERVEEMLVELTQQRAA